MNVPRLSTSVMRDYSGILVASPGRGADWQVLPAQLPAQSAICFCARDFLGGCATGCKTICIINGVTFSPGCCTCPPPDPPEVCEPLCRCCRGSVCTDKPCPPPSPPPFGGSIGLPFER